MRKSNDVINRRRKEGQFAQVMHRLRKNKAAMLGLGIVLVLIVLAILSPWIMPYDYTKMDIKNKYASPSAATGSAATSWGAISSRGCFTALALH